MSHGHTIPASLWVEECRSEKGYEVALPIQGYAEFLHPHPPNAQCCEAEQPRLLLTGLKRRSHF